MTEELGMKKGLKIFSLCLLLMIFSQSAFAKSPWTEEVGYGDKVRGKIVYGMANFWGGWIALYYEPLQAHEDHKNVFAGLGRGLVYAVTFTLGGIAHFVTAPLTFFDIPLPHNGVELS